MAQEALGPVDVLGALRDEALRHAQQHRHLLARVVERHRLGDDVVVVPLLVVHHRRRDGYGVVRRHHHFLRVEGVVVVGIAPVDRAGRHVALLVRPGEHLEGIRQRLLHRGVVRVQLAVRGDDAAAAIGDHHLIEQVVGIGTGGGERQAETIDMAHPHAAQLLLHRLEEREELVPGLRNVRELVAGLLHQRAPHRDVQCLRLDRHSEIGPPLRGIVVILRRFERGLAVLVLLRFHHVGDIRQLAIPHRLRHGLRRAVVGIDQVRHLSGRQRRDHLLVERVSRHHGEAHRDAALLLPLRHQVVEGLVLGGVESLVPPHHQGLVVRRARDVRPRQRRGREPGGSAQQCTPPEISHGRRSPCVRAPFPARQGCVVSSFGAAARRAAIGSLAHRVGGGNGCGGHLALG